jgi:hypothetical protein
MLLLVGCATQTASPDLTVPVSAVNDAQWTFNAQTKWSSTPHISITINKTALSGASEIGPGDIIGGYQGHSIEARCKTDWTAGTPYGTGTCYVFVDGIQTAILIL